MEKIRIIKCAVCGKAVEAKSRLQKYCLPCSLVVHREKSRERAKVYNKKQKHKPKKPLTKQSITGIAKMAYDAGMSYGKWVQMTESGGKTGKL